MSPTSRATLLVAALLAACSTTSEPPAPSAPVPSADLDAGEATDVDASGDAAEPVDAGDAAPQKTTATATFGGKTISFDRAQFGVVTDAAGSVVQIELHEGGEAACPTETSPTPLRTLILAGLKLPLAAGTRTYADGARATLLDFKGDVLAGPEPARATAVTVSIESARVRADAFAEGDSVVLDLDATFPDGTVAGRVVAARCASMDYSE